MSYIPVLFIDSEDPSSHPPPKKAAASPRLCLTYVTKNYKVPFTLAFCILKLPIPRNVPRRIYIIANCNRHVPYGTVCLYSREYVRTLLFTVNTSFAFIRGKVRDTTHHTGSPTICPYSTISGRSRYRYPVRHALICSV